ncbi:MAG: acyltransferase [Patescibacteria group bacterium]|jgi:peptidoglycan/LPS O-acetylase OafA/YrhL
MPILINNTVSSTYIFIIIFIVAVLLSIRKKKHQEFFSNLVSQELKGLATFMIIFGHIGYFLLSDHRFLFPLSIAAGVGVNLFLLLSGYGLTTSALRKHTSIWQFYKKRLVKLFIPLWLILIFFLVLDYFVLHRTYAWAYIVRSFLGWFPRADLAIDINSPLWYFSLILFYYLIFPLFFSKKYYWLSALAIYFTSYLLLHNDSGHFVDVIRLYKVHLLAFPLGVLLAGLYSQRHKLSRLVKIVREIVHHQRPSRIIMYYFLAGILLLVFAYTAYHSNVDRQPLKEQLTSLFTLLAVLVIFLIKKFDVKLFSLFGFYSYEIYLLHWPILYRYDLFYKYTPAWLATILYLFLFIFLGWLLKKITSVALGTKN